MKPKRWRSWRSIPVSPAKKARVVFRFDAGVHRYTAGDTGEHLPSVTQMLKATGHIETTWMTEAGRDRGTAVHALTAAYDLAALDLARCVSPFKGYLMGHVHAMQVLRPELLAVEEPIVHPLYRYGGRPDRDVKIDGLRGVLEIKTGGQEDWHSLQTALLAILVAEEAHLQA